MAQISNLNLFLLDDVCSLPIVTGPCEAYMSSWGYDATSRSCIHFGYGGCQGNGNRFSTKEECEARCSTKGKNLIIHSNHWEIIRDVAVTTQLLFA